MGEFIHSQTVDRVFLYPSLLIALPNQSICDNPLPFNPIYWMYQEKYLINSDNDQQRYKKTKIVSF